MVGKEFLATKELLTNESMRGVFKNNFELAHFAIRLARYYVHAGHEISLADLFDQVRKNPTLKYLEDLEALANHEEE
jgi:hypothetical protein